ncbi:flavin monoamine oxidase family protein [Nonlabens sp. Asnod3-A02]|uniref:flavin monoamine oxidase family protein n=1 Tax=Nonlabens sp. Asnod3-A02 TaxID=3160579 RepID=UPI003866DFA5
MKHYKYIIIGAGLSGLTTAFQLKRLGENDVLILESRERIGGRILTQKGIDLGATWFQGHHTHVKDVLQLLKIPAFNQYVDGNSILVYNAMAPAHYFKSDSNAPASQRIVGGSTSMIEALSSSIKDCIKTNTTVHKVIEKDNFLEVHTANENFTANKVVVTIPPRIVSHIDFKPQLPERLQTAMNATHTWMSHAIKAGITFKKPFWRERDLSGMLIGQIGPMTELYDHCDPSTGIYSLMGFVNEGLRDLQPADRKAIILKHIATYLGPEVYDYLEYVEKDWSIDLHTSSRTLKNDGLNPGYGNPIYQEEYFDGKLIFSGTETSPLNGGYMDGAIYSGIHAANKVAVS